jgi:aminoglycoside 2'-N-acetyltransferase I
VNITIVETPALGSALRREVLTLCHDAYGEELSHYLQDVGPGVHLLGSVDGALVSHAMIVTRELRAEGSAAWVTAYVELVATRPDRQRQGFGSRVMRALVPHMHRFDIAALSPAREAFYERLGWERWRGPLSVRTHTGSIATPDEQLMVLRLPRTPAVLNLEAPLSIEWRAGEAW